MYEFIKCDRKTYTLSLIAYLAAEPKCVFSSHLIKFKSSGQTALTTDFGRTIFKININILQGNCVILKMIRKLKKQYNKSTTETPLAFSMKYLIFF